MGGQTEIASNGLTETDRQTQIIRYSFFALYTMLRGLRLTKTIKNGDANAETFDLKDTNGNPIPWDRYKESLEKIRFSFFLDLVSEGLTNEQALIGIGLKELPNQVPLQENIAKTIK